MSCELFVSDSDISRMLSSWAPLWKAEIMLPTGRYVGRQIHSAEDSGLHKVLPPNHGVCRYHLTFFTQWALSRNVVAKQEISWSLTQNSHVNDRPIVPKVG